MLVRRVLAANGLNYSASRPPENAAKLRPSAPLFFIDRKNSQRPCGTAQEPKPAQLVRKLLELMGGLLRLREEARQVPCAQFNAVDGRIRELPAAPRPQWCP
jgi:hypothetical protein